MTSLEIYLGSISPPTEGSSSVVPQQAASLQEAHEKYGQTEANLASLKLFVKSSDLATAWSPMDLAAFSLQTNAQVSVHVEQDDQKESDLKAIQTAFLLAGLVASGERCDAQTRVLTAERKPTKTAGVTPLKKPVQLNLADDDLIDEDNLLVDSSNLLAPPPAMSQAASKTDDCGGRKACDNCSCGRADAEKAAAKSQNEKPVIQTSSCGKCGLGDAFRCASCPYLGKPAFKPGEEHLVLDLQDDL